jgi:hypothetical protein
MRYTLSFARRLRRCLELCMTLALGTIAMLSVTSFAALAQTAPPTYQADPGVYKVIFEDQNFRVMEGTWKKGERDKAHSHPVLSVGYALTDCVIRIHQPDGKTRDITNKAGTALTIPMTGSHSAENISPRECRVLLVERK